MTDTIVILNAVALDWLTLTTHSEDAYNYARRTLRNAADSLSIPLKSGRRMQYNGEESSYHFAGKGEQKGKDHYLVQVWGARAETEGADLLFDNDFSAYYKCTRMDVQWTNERPRPVDLPRMGALLEEAPASSWRFVGRRPRVDWYHNADKKHSLYIGSRTSHRMWRMYNKELEDGLHVRVEIEYKGPLAEQARDGYAEDRKMGLARLLHSEWFSLPDAACIFIPELADLHNLTGDRICVDYSQPELTGTVNWIMQAVCPAVERMMGTQYHAEVTEVLLNALGMMDTDGVLTPKYSRLMAD
jgi:plasmid stabilization system protein ParE